MTLGQKTLKKVNSPIKSPKLANTSLRKRALLRTLSNGVQFGAASKANLKVIVRIRPENKREIDSNARSVIDIVDDHVLIFDPEKGDDDFFFKGTKQKYRDLNKRTHKEQKFAFERVFGPSSTNEEIFETTTKAIVSTILEGYNCSVFAYGATGSGKTHTMIGREHQPGIAFLTVMELYNQIAKLQNTRTCEVGVSYLEVYNEMVRDLLNPSKPPLNLRETGQHVQVTDLSFHKPTDAQDLLRILAEGNCNRSQHHTDANSESSRSHAVFQVFVRQQDRSSDIKSSVSIAKLSMIDLAGSERGAVTGFRGARFREGANINKSLLALGNCINALADGKGHIPYRDSKLTRLLKDSIGGNCRSIMIATISRTSRTFEDTFNTLRYASRAKTIKTTLKKNLINVDQHVSQYLKVVEDLKGEMTVLKERLKAYEDGMGQAPEALTTPLISTEEKETYEETIQTLRMQLDEKQSIKEQKMRAEKEFLDALMDVNCQHKNYQREILQLESKGRELDMKIYMNRVYVVRMKVFAFASAKLDKGISKCERSIQSFENHLEYIHKRKEFLYGKLAETKECIFALCDQLKKKEFIDLGESPEMLINKLKQNESEQSLRDEHQINEYLRTLVVSLLGDQLKTEKLLALVLVALKHAFLRQKVAKECDPDTNDFLDKIYGMLDSSRIEWADLKDTEESFGEETVSHHVSLVPMINIDKLTKFPGLPSIDFSPAVLDISRMYKRSSMKKAYRSSNYVHTHKRSNAANVSRQNETPERQFFNPVPSRRLLNLGETTVKEVETEVESDPIKPLQNDRNLDTLEETTDPVEHSKDAGLVTVFCGATPPPTILGTPLRPLPFKGFCMPLPDDSPTSSVAVEDSTRYPLDTIVTIDSSHPTEATSANKIPSPVKESLLSCAPEVQGIESTSSDPEPSLEFPSLAPSPRPDPAESLSIVDSVNSEVNQTITLSVEGNPLCRSPSPSLQPERAPSPVQDLANSTFCVGVTDAMETFIISPDESDVNCNSKVVLQPVPSSVVKNKENLPTHKLSSKKGATSLTSSKHSFSKLPANMGRHSSSRGFRRSVSISSLPAVSGAKNTLTNSHSKGATLKKSTSFLKPRFGSTTKNQENVAPRTVAFGSTAHLNLQREGTLKRTLHFNSSTSLER